MTTSELKTLLETSGISFAYHHWEQPPAPPYGVYLFVGDADLIADDCNFARINEWQVELYSNTKNESAEQAIEQALVTASIPFEKTETYLDSEAMYQVLYIIRTN